MMLRNFIGSLVLLGSLACSGIYTFGIMIASDDLRSSSPEVLVDAYDINMNDLTTDKEVMAVSIFAMMCSVGLFTLGLLILLDK